MPVVNLNFEKFDVRVDRKSKWGNDFHIGKHGDRATVIKEHRLDLWKKIRGDKIDLVELASLDGKRLGCHCAPLDCHAETLEKAARWAVAVLDRYSARTGQRPNTLTFSKLEAGDLAA